MGFHAGKEFVIMKKVFFAACMIVLVSGAWAQTVIFEDNFSASGLTGYSTTSDTTGSGAPDVSADGGFDFSTLGLGIPSAPNGSDTLALKAAANIAADERECINVYYDTPISTNYFEVQVDMWLNFADSGTTEHSGFGIFGSGSKANWSTIYDEENQNTDTDGLLFAFNSDGDEARSDLFLTRGTAEGLTDVGLWENPEDSSPLGQIYGNDPYADIAGEDGWWGEKWLTVVMRFYGGTVTVTVNDVVIVSYVENDLNETTDRKLFLYHSDPFGSVASPSDEAFSLFDNLKITELEPPPPVLSAENVWNLYE